MDVGVFAPFAGRAVSGGADIVPGIREAFSASFSDGVPIIPRRALAVCGVFCGIFHDFRALENLFVRTLPVPVFDNSGTGKDSWHYYISL